MKANIYSYRDYKAYLNDQLELRSRDQRGPKARLAESIGCHLAYLSQVLNGSAHLSLEQADGCNRFFGHNKIESLFLLNLVQYARAGTTQLKQVFADQIKETVDQQKMIKNRLNLMTALTAEHQAVYYSSWEYAAIHIATSIPLFQAKLALSEGLGFSVERISEVLDFLCEIGLVKQNKGKYEMTDVAIHLGADSPFLTKHHANWRVHSLRSLDQVKSDDLHYSAAISCNDGDIPKIREVLIAAIAEIRKIVKDSKNENCLMSYCLDLFPVIKK